MHIKHSLALNFHLCWAISKEKKTEIIKYFIYIWKYAFGQTEDKIQLKLGETSLPILGHFYYIEIFNKIVQICNPRIYTVIIQM